MYDAFKVAEERLAPYELSARTQLTARLRRGFDAHTLAAEARHPPPSPCRGRRWLRGSGGSTRQGRRRGFSAAPSLATRFGVFRKLAHLGLCQMRISALLPVRAACVC